jgi:hypothetical protein
VTVSFPPPPFIPGAVAPRPRLLASWPGRDEKRPISPADSESAGISRRRVAHTRRGWWEDRAGSRILFSRAPPRVVRRPPPPGTEQYESVCLY